MRIIVGNNDRGASVLLQNGKDMLEEVELFVARARPEIVAMHDERLFLFVAGFINDGGAALLPNGRLISTISYSACLPAR
jgi:hypothetical protein